MKFLSKTSVPIIPTRKNFLVPIKGILKWPSCDKMSVKNLRLCNTTYRIFCRAGKGGLKMAEFRKKFCEKPPSIPPRKFFRVPTKGVLKRLSCEKISVKKLRPYPSRKNVG